MEEKSIKVNSTLFNILNFGHKRLLSALTWTKTIMDSDISHDRSANLNSWMFYRINLITTLEPYYYDVYLIGGQYLSIIKDDLKGASIIYDKGIDYFPRDFSLLYNGGFHYLHEVKDLDQATKLYQRLYNLEGSVDRFPLLPSILAKLLSKNINMGSNSIAIEIVTEMLLKIPKDHPLRRHYEKLLAKLTTQK